MLARHVQRRFRRAPYDLTGVHSDASFLEFPYDPPEWDVDRSDYMMAEPLQVGADGHIVLSDSPEMGHDLATDRLASTRIA